MMGWPGGCVLGDPASQRPTSATSPGVEPIAPTTRPRPSRLRTRGCVEGACNPEGPACGGRDFEQAATRPSGEGPRRSIFLLEQQRAPFTRFHGRASQAGRLPVRPAAVGLRDRRPHRRHKNARPTSIALSTNRPNRQVAKVRTSKSAARPEQQHRAGVFVWRQRQPYDPALVELHQHGQAQRRWRYEPAGSHRADNPFRGGMGGGVSSRLPRRAWQRGVKQRTVGGARSARRTAQLKLPQRVHDTTDRLCDCRHFEPWPTGTQRSPRARDAAENIGASGPKNGSRRQPHGGRGSGVRRR